PARLGRPPARSDGTGLRLAITVPVPSDRLAARWGDWHFASALARSLERLGHLAFVVTLDRAQVFDWSTCDAIIEIRGRRWTARRPRTPRLLWIVSHPETVTIDECDAADV